MTRTSSRVKIWGASTLDAFTARITEGFQAEQALTTTSKEFDFALVQLHGSPNSKEEDEHILETTSDVTAPKIFLVHRPDEIISNPKFISYFERHLDARFILLGDLVFGLPFWKSRIKNIKVIPHPYMDFSTPHDGQTVVGSFTSWGEMRKLEHFVRLAEALKDSTRLQFKIGGTGIDKASIPSYIEITEKFFVPHFNVQLYHLNGRKRLGESSGSLHRGISIPVIFEANGMERLEKIRAVKVTADNDLKEIDFSGAALQIIKIESENLRSWLEANRQSALKNSPQAFARSLLNFFSQNPISVQPGR
jgi:hypothetical protein